MLYISCFACFHVFKKQSNIFFIMFVQIKQLIMKNLIILFSIFTIFSCSEESQNQNDPIVGTWQMTFVIVEGQIFKDYTNGAIPCFGNSTWEFTETFDLNTISYYGDSNDSCVTLEETVSWSKINNQYQVNSTLKEIIFPDENTMQWLYFDNDGINPNTYWQFQRTN